MSTRHFAFWPKRLQQTLTLPQTSLYHNVEVSAKRYPNRPFILFYDTPISYREFQEQTEFLAGYLKTVCKVKKGDRVLLYMQNSPQFILGYYAILRANAVVIPVNPMNQSDEFKHYIKDSGATTVLVSQELFENVKPHLNSGKDTLSHAVVACYSDYLIQPTDLKIPDYVSASREDRFEDGAITWNDALKQKIQPGPITVGPDDLCVMPYTSGTTGHPKACMHTHRSVMATTVGNEIWFGSTLDDVRLTVIPLFHVTGMQGSMNSPIYTGATIVLLPRWDREVAAQCIDRYKITSFSSVPTMIVDFLANPNLKKYDISSIKRLNGGGTAMPEAIAQKLQDMGINFVEGYGLSETMAASHINPPERPKKQCLGIPIFGVESRILDPNTLKEVPPGETGEIFTSGPQVFKGYWNNPEATKEALIELDGKTFLKTGDLGKIDEDGYFFMVDRLKRMINASGYKVWPAEVELMLYQHPAIQEACIIAAKDQHRGETVKALIVLKPEFKGKVTEQELIHWAGNNMARYKAPKLLEFIDQLPKSGSGKIQWRTLQEQELTK
jgi:fatty-acyl-CoA synthase